MTVHPLSRSHRGTVSASTQYLISASLVQHDATKHGAEHPTDHDDQPDPARVLRGSLVAEVLHHGAVEEGGDSVEHSHIHPVGEEQQDVALVGHQVLDRREIGLLGTGRLHLLGSVGRGGWPVLEGCRIRLD